MTSRIVLGAIAFRLHDSMLFLNVDIAEGFGTFAMADDIFYYHDACKRISPCVIDVRNFSVLSRDFRVEASRTEKELECEERLFTSGDAERNVSDRKTCSCLESARGSEGV